MSPTVKQATGVACHRWLKRNTDYYHGLLARAMRRLLGGMFLKYTLKILTLNKFAPRLSYAC